MGRRSIESRGSLRCSGLDKLQGWYRGDWHNQNKANPSCGEMVVKTRYKPVMLPVDAVLENLGLAEGKPRTPYNDLRPAVTPEEQVGHYEYGHGYRKFVPDGADGDLSGEVAMPGVEHIVYKAQS